MKNHYVPVSRIRRRQGIINIDINAQIKKYQRKLVELSFSHKNNEVSIEYQATLDKIHVLRESLLN